MDAAATVSAAAAMNAMNITTFTAAAEDGSNAPVTVAATAAAAATGLGAIVMQHPLRPPLREVLAGLECVPNCRDLAEACPCIQPGHATLPPAPAGGPRTPRARPPTRPPAHPQAASSAAAPRGTPARRTCAYFGARCGCSSTLTYGSTQRRRQTAPGPRCWRRCLPAAAPQSRARWCRGCAACRSSSAGGLRWACCRGCPTPRWPAPRCTSWWGRRCSCRRGRDGGRGPGPLPCAPRLGAHAAAPDAGRWPAAPPSPRLAALTQPRCSHPTARQGVVMAELNAGGLLLLYEVLLETAATQARGRRGGPAAAPPPPHTHPPTHTHTHMRTQLAPYVQAAHALPPATPYLRD